MLTQRELHDLLALQGKNGCSPDGKRPCFCGRGCGKFVIRTVRIIGIRICRFLFRGDFGCLLGLFNRFRSGLLGFLLGFFLGCALGNFVLFGRPLGERIVLHDVALTTQEHK